MKIIAAGLLGFFVFNIFSFAYAAHIDFGQEIFNVISKIAERIKYAYHALDAWLDKIIGFNFTKLFKLIADITLWFFKLAIKLVKWFIDLIL